MKRFDQHCTVCDWADEILAAPFTHPPCPQCGGATERYYPIGGTRQVISDEIIGGMWLENIAPRPVWVESKSHMRRELAARGLEQKVQHRGTQDSDKSVHTSRWI